jgi:coenzyme PQQ precursor peptide PqqA
MSSAGRGTLLVTKFNQVVRQHKTFLRLNRPCPSGVPTRIIDLRFIRRKLWSGYDNLSGSIQRGEIMQWTTPKFEEIALNCEINSYASAAM